MGLDARRRLGRLLLLVCGALAACAPALERACTNDADCPARESCTGAGRCVPSPAAPRSDDGVQGPDAAPRGDARTPPEADLALAPPALDVTVALSDGAAAWLDGSGAPPSDALVAPPDATDDTGPMRPGDASPDARRPGVDATPDALGSAPDVRLPPPADAFVPTPDACFSTAEICNGLDDDCNGIADDDPDGTPMRLECYDGVPETLGRGICRAGTTRCVAGQPLPCQDQVLPASEICNSLDDDCNGTVDDVANLGRPCVEGVGACARQGSLVCLGNDGPVSCSASAGMRTSEVCNGVDDDCNGHVDDGVLAEEVCNERDDDCDGSADEGLGVGEPCSVGLGGCRQDGVFRCGGDGRRMCSVVASPPAIETCDGTDENCNGTVDDVQGLGEGCTAGFGLCARQGVRICQANSAVPVCSAQPGLPEEERCDALDHDCDGVPRNVPVAQIAFGVPYLNLSAFSAGCAVGGGELAGRFCSVAIHQYCATQNGCWASGFGPTFGDGAAGTANVVCLHDGVDIVQSSIGQLALQHANCNGVNKLGGIYCNAAIDNYCWAHGMTDGYGPIRFDAAGNVDFVCLRGPLTVDRVLAPWAALTALHGDCNQSSAQAQAGGACMYAANQYCLRENAYAGFGPVQDANPNALVICLRR